MPRRNSLTRRLLHHLFLVSLASGVLAVLGRGRAWDEWDGVRKPRLTDPDLEPATPDTAPAASRPRSRTRRFATAVSFCTLFFAGLALSAGAGDTMRGFLDGDGATVAQTGTDTTTTYTTTTDGADVTAPDAGALAPDERAAVPATEPEVQAPSDAVRTAVPAAPRTVVPTVAPLREARLVPSAAPTKKPARTQVVRTPARKQRTHHVKALKKKAKAPPLDAEACLSGATVWLHQAAPDPTPRSARLRLRFARQLATTSKQVDVGWALVLAVLRAEGQDGRIPATRAELRRVTRRLAAANGRTNPWAAALAFSGQPEFADRAVALMHYYRAAGLAGLVDGLESQKADLQDRVLHDSRLEIYPGGREDVAKGRIDVRVLTLMLYLADTYHEVTVSCLLSGHRLYARPGVISAHIYGRAVDIAALGGVSIYGHQQPGGLTEQAVRSILFLPGGMLPAQVISLLGLGGPSFPLANHYDHIHVGY